MYVEPMLDYTLFVGDTAIVIGPYPEAMVKVTAIVGKDRVLAEIILGEGYGTQHGYDRKQLSKRFSLGEVFDQMIAKK